MIEFRPHSDPSARRYNTRHLPQDADSVASDLNDPILEIRGDQEDVLAVRGDHCRAMVTNDQGDVCVHDVGVSALPAREPDPLGGHHLQWDRGALLGLEAEQRRNAPLPHRARPARPHHRAPPDGPDRLGPA